jgi:hypothetical protein
MRALNPIAWGQPCRPTSLTNEYLFGGNRGRVAPAQDEAVLEEEEDRIEDSS